MQITGLARNAAPGKQMDANQWSIENESMGALALSLDFFFLRLIFFLSIFFNFQSHALRFFSYFFLKRALRAFGQS